MDWDAISAISHLVGSLAAVLSVLYLAAQVHQSTRVARLATQDAAATALRDVTKPLMEGFSERFRNFVNSLEPPADQRTVGALFNAKSKTDA